MIRPHVEIMFVAIVVLACAVVMIAIELLVARRSAGRAFPTVANWWMRALFFNGLQALSVYVAALSYDTFMADHRPWSAEHLGAGGILVGYAVHAFVYYWWHRWRHESGFLWRWFHQLHHSPQRIEVITSFYKHPFEILGNGLLSSAVLYLVVGLSPAQAASVMLVCGVAELFYHWNVPTPHWLGYIIQRPESHCVHHQAGLHAYNYGDLPILDMMFGTFRNPRSFDIDPPNTECGMGADNEHRVAHMLLGHDLSDERPQGGLLQRLGILLLLGAGLLQMGGDVVGSRVAKGIGAASVVSPAPKVFTAVRGYEALSTRFELTFVDGAGRRRLLQLRPHPTNRLAGPYNRRNVYGAALAFGPVLPAALRDPVLVKAMCGDAPVLRELGIDPRDVSGDLRLHYRTRAGSAPRPSIEVTCP